jgi:hypothetical protein
MKKYIIALVFAVVGGSAITSCSDSFLDEHIQAQLAPETLATPAGFDALIVGLHRQYFSFHTKDDTQGWLSVWQAGTDIAWVPQPQAQGIEKPYYNYELLSSTDAGASFAWTWAYKLIKNANVIIASVENPALTTMTQAQKDPIDAEARFFRALAYDFLVTTFGDVPLTTALVTAPKTDFVRTPVSEVDKVIEDDLAFAVAHLPNADNVITSGRICDAAARQLLAEAYLRMGRPADAEAQCQAIIASNKFSLITARYGKNVSQPGDAFSDMFRVGNMRRAQGNKEGIWIFEVDNAQFDLLGANTGSPQQRRVWGGGYYNIPGMALADTLGGRGISRLRLNNWVLYGLYPAGDMRNSQFSIKRKFWYNDATYDGHDATHPNLYRQRAIPKLSGQQPLYADTMYKMHPYTLKWGQFDSRDTFGYGMWKDLPVMRLGETYLLLAEAQFKQGKLSEAAITINALRTRAHAPLISASDITLDFILDERVRELIGEENRRITLMRTGTLYDRVARLNPPVPGNPVGINITNLTADKAKFLPIPQSEINLNKDVILPQNPGY